MLNHRSIACGAALGFASILAMAGSVLGAPADAGLMHKGLVGETLDWPTGELDFIGINSGSLTNLTKDHVAVYDKTISVPVAGWIRLYFGEVNLDKGSVLRVTSLFDDEVQVLDAGTLDRWDNTTAYFNGSAVRVELIAAPGSGNNSLEIEYVAFQDVATIERGDGCGICGADDRQPASSDLFARLYPYGCSATLYNEESCLVTAGHCLSGQTVVQFRIPNSSSDCYTNNPGVADQFPITASDGVDGGVGVDFGAIQVGANSSGQLPYDRYGVYMEPAGSVPSSGSASVSGYGVDDECVYSQTLQSHTGSISGFSGTTLYYDIDGTYGNSGSSIVANNQIIGVMTHCSFGCENYGTAITSSAFQAAMASACAGGGGGGGGCPTGEIEDCFGNCCPESWVADGFCDDGSYEHNGVAIYLNCDEFNCDGGDCDPAQCGDGGGGGTGACCLPDENCTDGVSSDDCAAFGGTYQGDDSSCASTECGGGGGPCDAGWSADCVGTCFPDEYFDAWTGDGYCDDGTYIPYDYGCTECEPGVGMFLNCDEFNCDNGDCDPSQCGGGGGGTGACCLPDESCTDGASSDDCAAFGGTYQGDDSSCAGTECGGGGGPCDVGYTADCVGTCFPDYVFESWNGDGYCDDGSYVPYDYGCAECEPGVALYLNCDEFNCDSGDCDPSQCGGGGGGTGACCLPDENCTDGASSDDCAAFGGTYQGDDSSCAGTECGGGGGGEGDTCADAVVASVGGNAFSTSGNSDSGFGSPDDSQCADTFLDWGASPDAWFVWTAPGDGTASFNTCDASSYDTSLVLYEGDACEALVQIACNGDAADDTGCQDYHSRIEGIAVLEGDVYHIRLGGWEGASGSGTLTIEGDFTEPQTGACCVDNDCLPGYLQADCDNLKGDFQGVGTSCDDDSCAAPCDGDANGDGLVNVTDLLGVIGEWQCNSGCSFDVNGDGTVNVTDLLAVIGNWGPCS